MKKVLAVIIAAFMLIGILGTVESSAYVKYDSLDDYGDASNSALAMIQGDGVDLYATSDTGSQAATVDYLFMNKDTVHGPFSTLTFKGWFGTNLDIIKVGYAIGDEEPVFKDEFKTEAPLWGTQSGVNYATGYNITIDVSGLSEEKTLIKPVVMLEDNTVLEATFLTVYYSSKPAEEEAKPEIIELTTNDGSGAFNFNSARSVAFKIVVPEGKKLVKFTILSSPTWNGPPTGVGLTATIYKWLGDFESSTDSDYLDDYEEEDHKDNANLDIVYDYIPAGEYLIVCTDYHGNIGGWNAGRFIDEYASSFDYFLNGESAAPPVKCAITLIDDTTPAPTEIPATEVPADPTATAESGNAGTATEAAATEAPKTTDAPQTTEAPKNNANGSSKAGLILGIAGGVIVVAAIVAGIVVSKKRKK